MGQIRCIHSRHVQGKAMSDDLDEILSSVFHGCAIAAYVDQMNADGQWPPDIEATKQRANRYYEEELARKHRRRAQQEAA
jgi:hypothetical protein